MKKLYILKQFENYVLLYILLISSLTLYGQRISEYSFSQHNRVYEEIPVNSSPVFSAFGWDNPAPVSINMGFNFNFRGESFSSVSINPNGYLTFGTTNSSATNYTPISASTTFRGAVSALGINLRSDGSTNSLIRYTTSGVSPNRVFIVQWRNTKFSTTDGNLNFQIRLYETSNMIEVAYGSFSSVTGSYNTQVGLRGVNNVDFNNRSSSSGWTTTISGTVNNQTVNVNPSNLPPNGLVFRWTPVMFHGNGSITIPCGVTSIKVETWGGGGGGGRSTDNGQTTGGGGGGGYATKTFDVTPGTIFYYSVGNGGSGGSGTKDGGDTWFNNVNTQPASDTTFAVLSSGGRGVTNNSETGGDGGTPTYGAGFSGGKGGDGSGDGGIHGSGGGGGAARNSGNGGNGEDGQPRIGFSGGIGGNGGASTSPGGTGGKGTGNGGDGYNGFNYGGGGGGGKRALIGFDNQNGGNGANGVVRITYTYEDEISPVQNVTSSEGSELSCDVSSTILTASGGNVSGGVSTLWYESYNCPSLAFIEEFNPLSYSITNASILNQSNGNITLKANNNDPNIHMEDVLNSQFDPTIHRYIVFRYRVISGTGGSAVIYIKKRDLPLDETRTGSIDLITDSQWHVASVDMSENTFWNTSNGGVTGWRFDFTNIPDMEMEIDYLVLSSVPMLDNINSDDSLIEVSPTLSTSQFGALRISEKSGGCEIFGNSATSCTTINISRYDKTFIGNGIWNDPANWYPAGVPNIDNCVSIPAGSSVLVNNNSASARNIVNNGDVTIASLSSLTINDEIVNNAGADNFVIADNASLIQINDLAINSGEIKVEKQFTFVNGTNPANDRKQYNFVISPVVDQNIKTIYDGNPTVIQYRESDNFFYNHNGSYTAGKGLAIKEPSKTVVPGSTVTANFRGIPFNGILNYPLNYSGPGFGYNLIGNPYPSNLDIQLLYNNNSSVIESTFLFWDNRGNTQYTQQGDQYNGSNYAIYNAVSGTGLPAGAAAPGAPAPARIPNQYVKVGTGFIVQAKSEGNIRFKNSYRSNDNSGPAFFGKYMNQNSLSAEHATDINTENENQKDRYWLTLTTMSGMEFMNAVVYFDEGTNEYAADDSDAMGASDEIFTLVGQQYLAINGRAPFENTDVVPLGVRHFAEGKFIIDIHTKEGVFANGQKIYLKDNYLNKLHELTLGYYEYESEAGEFIDRFEILYKNPGVTDPVFTASNLNHLKISKENHHIVIDSSIDKITAVEIFNLAGWSIYKKDNVNSQEHKVAAQSLGKGIIIVNVVTEKGEVVSRKFINN